MELKPYKKDGSYSYAQGAFATIELLQARPQHAREVIIHSNYRDSSGLLALCREKGVSVRQNDRIFKRINQKENTYVMGVFSKYEGRLAEDAPHVVLVNPSDMGNLGTIVRTLVGFGVLNLAVINPAADFWNPRVVRASMGALFRLEVEGFSDFLGYAERFAEHRVFPFMLDGDVELRLGNVPRAELYSLVFGNEAAGLGDEFRMLGTSVRLPQSGLVDSLNLAVAVGVGVFLFEGETS